MNCFSSDGGRDAVMAVLSDDKWLTIEDVMQASSASYHYVRINLRSLLNKELIESQTIQKAVRHRMTLWRKVRPGRILPLYTQPPGFDIELLAECFGGYTYRKGT